MKKGKSSQTSPPPPSSLSVNTTHPNFRGTVHRFVLRSVYSIATSVGGTITFITSNDASTSSDFSSLSALFDSYRVRKIHQEWIPNFSRGSTQSLPPIYLFFDLDDPNVVSGINESIAVQYPNCKILPVDKYYHASAEVPKVNSIAAGVGAYSVNDGFIDIATPVATCSIQAYSTGLAASTTYGTLINTYEVDFIARR